MGKSEGYTASIGRGGGRTVQGRLSSGVSAANSTIARAETKLASLESRYDQLSARSSRLERNSSLASTIQSEMREIMNSTTSLRTQIDSLRFELSRVSNASTAPPKILKRVLRQTLREIEVRTNGLRWSLR